MLADLITEVLDQHRPESVSSHPTYTTWSWRYECGCDWTGKPFVMGEAADRDARRVADRHVAEQVAEALAHGAPVASGEVQW